MNMQMIMNNVNPTPVNYKLLKTGVNNPQVSSRMKYSQLANNVNNFSKYPLCNIKNPVTGIVEVDKTAVVKIVYINQKQSTGPIQNQPQQSSFTTYICTTKK